jgi:hypothetical protein
MTDMDKILAGLDDQVRTNIIFDACRNNPMAQQVASASKQVPWSNSSLLGEVYLATK